MDLFRNCIWRCCSFKRFWRKSFFKLYAYRYSIRYVFWHSIHLYTSTKRNRSSASSSFLLSTNSHSHNGCFKLFSMGKTDRKGLVPTFSYGNFTQIAQVLMTKGLQSAAVNKIISVKYIGTFWALAFGYILFGESYSWLSIVGILLVMFGVVLNLKTKSDKLWTFRL